MKEKQPDLEHCEHSGSSTAVQHVSASCTEDQIRTGKPTVWLGAVSRFSFLR